MLSAITIIIIIEVEGGCKGGRSGELLFNGHRVSVLPYEKVLEVGCTSM